MTRHHKSLLAAGVLFLLATMLPPAGRAALRRYPTVYIEVSEDGATLHTQGYRKRIQRKADFGADEVVKALRFYASDKHTPVVLRFGPSADKNLLDRLGREIQDYGVRSLSREQRGAAIITTETFVSPPPSREKPPPPKRAAPPPPAPKTDVAAAAAATNPRKALWDAFWEVCPESYRDMEAFAEDTGLTAICFRSGGKTFLYTVSSGRIEPVEAGPAAADVNRITWEDDAFVLWHYGERRGAIRLP